MTDLHNPYRHLDEKQYSTPALRPAAWISQTEMVTRIEAVRVESPASAGEASGDQTMTMLNRRGPAVSPYYLKGMIEAWDPPEKPHCSNCRWATVSGTSDEPMVTCAQGHGKKPLALAVVIRARHPRQFTPAVNCPDFEGMGLICNVHRP